MDIEGALKTAVTVLTPLAALVGVGSRRRRLRGEIKENLALLKALQAEPLMRDHTPAAGWLGGRVALDVARLSGQPLGQRKKPIPVGSVVLAAILGISFGSWTWFLTRNGFVWYAIFPGTITFLFVIAALGMFMGREIPDDPDLPAGATPVRLGSGPDKIVAGVQLAASRADAELHGPGGRAEVALDFVRLMREGQYEAALDLADPDWILCRIQSRFWTSRAGWDLEELASVVERLYEHREPRELWQEYVAAEAAQFQKAWAGLDPDQLGIATRRRRLAQDYDLVILTPLTGGDGFFVTEPTVLPNALTFLLHNIGGQWRVANHVGIAPPMPGLPPSWWAQGDYPFDASAADPVEDDG